MPPMKPFTYVVRRIFPEVERYILCWEGNQHLACSPAQEGLSPPADCMGDSDRCEELLNTAFDAVELLDRGRAWTLISRLPATAMLRQHVREALIQRFGLPPSLLDDRLLDMWLDGVRDAVRRAEREAASRDVEARYVEVLAGSDLESIGPDLSSITRFLRPKEPGRRVAAVFALLKHASDAPDTIRLVEESVMSDPDLSVRIIALRSFIDLCCSRSRGGYGLSVLAKIVADSGASIEERDLSYQGMFEVFGAPAAEWPSTLACEGKFAFPDDVDWDFVARYCSDSTL